MAVTQSSVSANLGSGVLATKALHGVARELSILPGMAMPMKRSIGHQGATWIRLGAAIAAAAFSEASAAVTPTTLPTVTQVTANPAGYQASMGPTDEARLRAIDDNDPMQLMHDEIIYALKIYPAADSAVSIAYQFTQVSATGGVTGGALTRASCLAAGRTVRAAVKSERVHVFIVIEGKGYSDLQTEAAQAGAGVYGNSTVMTQELRALLAKDGFDPEANGYRYSFDAVTHLFVVHSPDHLLTSAGDKFGCAFVPALPALQGYAKPSEMQSKLMPAFGIVYDEDPCYASASTMTDPKYIAHDGGMAVIASRAFAGQRQAVMDGFGSMATAILNQSAACTVQYLA